MLKKAQKAASNEQVASNTQDEVVQHSSLQDFADEGEQGGSIGVPDTGPILGPVMGAVQGPRSGPGIGASGRPTEKGVTIKIGPAKKKET